MPRYRANAPRFVDESVEGEALIMDMVTGTYYTCLGATTVAWEALKRGVDQHDVASLVASAYGVGAADVERDLEPFVADLLNEELLVPWTEEAGETVAVQLDDLGETTGAYEAMRLERYTDLADLILLDPVHDVSGTAWPDQ
jgi:hypothetical protein